MIFKILCSLLLVTSNFASALYVNETTSYTPYTKTLTPTYSVSPQETTLTYSDETTTFYITSTFYSTYWFTTSQIGALTESGSTYTSTLTSTLLVTVYNSQASNTIATSTAGDAASNVDALEKLTRDNFHIIP
nr:ADM_HP1_G0051340.mRNA.1.CDS.1 [Saccharomyces cerevisiae]